MDSKRECVKLLNNRTTELTIIPTIMKQLKPLHCMLPYLKGDYRVQPNSPALRLGFRNFPMDNFGVLKSEFRAEAKDGHQRFDEAKIQIP